MAALPDKAARPDLCGGTGVTQFPTAIAKRKEPANVSPALVAFSHRLSSLYRRLFHRCGEFEERHPRFGTAT